MALNNTFITTGSGGAGLGKGTGVGGRGGDVHLVTNVYASGASVISPLMHLPRAEYASHDSGRKGAPLPCLQGTRVAILDEIVSWLESENGERPPIYWLNGIAGIGKSTIAKTVAERAEERGMLGASFFFSRSNGPLHDPQLVFPTIAFQLAQSDDEFKKVILDAVQEDMTFGTKTLLPQLQGLIIMPLLKVNPNRQAAVIILDALDECDENGVVEILQLLFSHGTRIPFLRIFIASRPEPHILSVFDETPNVAKRVLHDIESSVIQQDIRFYLHSELSQIPQKFRLRMSPNWVSEDEINSLTEKAGKLFVYAATSIRFISDNRVRNPRRQLHLILNNKTAKEVGATPYRQLDSLYMGVLLNSLSDSNRRDVLERFQVVVGSIVLLRESLPLCSLARFVQYEIEEINATLYHLGSVIIPPSNEDDVPRIYHPSFRDFILDASRCSDPGFVIVPLPSQERRHAIRCFELLAKFLKRDMAGILDPSLLNEEVVGFEEKVKGAVSPEVRYACRYWAWHLSQVESGDELVEKELERFSMESILWWFETMSLIGSVSTAVNSIEEAHRWVIKSKCESTLITMLADAHRFILAHGEVIRAGALHVYESALPFTPHNTALYRTYCNEAKHSIRVLQGVESEWSRSLNCLRGHSEAVTSIAFSPDGCQLASASSDSTVRLWDATSGAPVAALKGDSSPLTSIAFSPNGSRLALGSWDHSVKLWDPMSGTRSTTLEGHSDWVTSIAFSPNGLRLASGSEDRTIRLWDPLSGIPIALLQGHSDPVTSIVFSPNGSRLASGSWDRTVRLWDAVSGTPVVTLKGHSKPVTSIAFSPNGSRVASGSWDCTIRFWDAMSGASITILEGHSDRVTSIAFSSNGLRLASGSWDCTVRLWDPMSGTPIAILEGQSGWVTFVAFSPNGSQLASGSRDRTVRLWDAMSGTPIATLQGHSESVMSAVFSPNGSRLASGSWDCTVRFWDVTSGPPIATLRSHSDRVTSIAFSPNGLQLASGSWDRTVRLWDAMSGTPIATLEGHLHMVTSVAFSPDGSRLASGSWDCTVRLWDTVSATPIATLEGHSEPVTSIAFSLNGLQLASNSLDRVVRWWDAESGTPITTLEGHSESVMQISFSPGAIWCREGQWIRVLVPPKYHPKRVCCIPPLYSPSTHIAAPSLLAPSRIAIGCEDGHIIMLDVQGHT